MHHSKKKAIKMLVFLWFGCNVIFLTMPVSSHGLTYTAWESSQADWEKHAVDLEDMRDWKGMLNWCMKWAKNDPNNFKAWFGLGAAYANIDKHDDAIEAYLRALSIDPETANAWYNLGYSYFRLNLYNNAVEAYSQALRIDPEMTNAWYNLGAAYAKLNRYDDAIKAFFQSQSMDPEFFNKLFNQTIIH